MSEWTIDAVKEHGDQRIADLKSHYDDKLGEFAHRLDGFPQDFTKRADGETLRTTVESIRADHVQRREIDEIKDAQRVATEDVRKRLDESTGRRQAAQIAISVVVAIFAVTLGSFWKNQLTTTQVRDQIAAQAPWLKDKPAVEAQIVELQKQNVLLRAALDQEETLTRFLCRNLQQTPPGC